MNATDNLRQQWLYRDNPNLQVSAPRRTAKSGTLPDVATDTVVVLSSYLTLSEEFAISDALFVEFANMTVGTSTGAGAVNVLSGSLMVGPPDATNRYQIGQLLSTGLYIPNVAAQDLAGFGANMVLAEPPTGILVLMNDLANYAPAPVTFPTQLELDLFLTIGNSSSGTITLYYQSLFKWRHIYNVNDEG